MENKVILKIAHSFFTQHKTKEFLEKFQHDKLNVCNLFSVKERLSSTTTSTWDIKAKFNWVKLLLCPFIKKKILVRIQMKCLCFSFVLECTKTINFPAYLAHFWEIIKVFRAFSGSKLATFGQNTLNRAQIKPLDPSMRSCRLDRSACKTITDQKSTNDNNSKQRFFLEK